MHPKLTLKSVILSGLLFLVSNVFAQQRTITGNVTSNLNQQPIAGATVVVKGTNIATQTNSDGNFTVTVPNAKSTLLITTVGYEPIEISGGSASPLNLSLKATNTTLNEVVVTGYTSQTKKDITGSVAVVNVKELTANPGSNIENLLHQAYRVRVLMCECMATVLSETMSHCM